MTVEVNARSEFDDERAALHATARFARAEVRLLAARALRAREEAANILDMARVSRATAREIRADIRQTIARHTQTMRKLGYSLEQVVAIVQDLADAVTREMTAEAGHGIWPRGTELREELVKWTATAYHAPAD